jgi:hypothetical protein
MCFVPHIRYAAVAKATVNPTSQTLNSEPHIRYAAVAKARDQLDLRALDMTIASQGKSESLPLHELGVDFGPLFRCVQVQDLGFRV